MVGIAPNDVAVLVGCVGSAVAAITDLRLRRIPNVITYSMMICALLILLWRWAVMPDPDMVWDVLGGFLLIGGAWLVVYAIGGCGGGDVKLMAANGGLLGLWLGLQLSLFALIAAVLYFLVLLIAQLIWRLTPGTEWLGAIVRGHAVDAGAVPAPGVRPGPIKVAIPFAVPIALGYLSLLAAMSGGGPL